MKIVAISDLHGDLPTDLPPADVLVIAGDICPDYDVVRQAAWLDTQFRSWLEAVPARHVVGICGNHDLVFEQGQGLVPKDLRWTYLQDSGCTIEGTTFYGVPWILPIWGAFQASSQKLWAIYEMIPDGTDVLISHGPPFMCGDRVPRRHYITQENEEKWPEASYEHVGSAQLLARIDEIKPKLVVCGHIHEDHGVKEWADTTIMNAAMPLRKGVPLTFKLRANP